MNIQDYINDNFPTLISVRGQRADGSLVEATGTDVQSAIRIACGRGAFAETCQRVKYRELSADGKEDFIAEAELHQNVLKHEALEHYA